MADPLTLAPRQGATWRPLLLPGFLAFLLVLFLSGLGAWQLHRLTWKLAILAEIRASESKPGIPLADHPGPYAKVIAQGRLRLDLAALYADQVRTFASGAVAGAQLLVPLERPSGPPILVDLGWVPLDQRLPPGLPEGPTSINGYVQPADHAGLFSAPDDPADRRFFTLDPARIGHALGLEGLAPFTLIAMGASPPGTYPIPAGHLPHPRNEHLQYALTWFGLAFVVALEFAIWARPRLRA